MTTLEERKKGKMCAACGGLPTIHWSAERRALEIWCPTCRKQPILKNEPSIVAERLRKMENREVVRQNESRALALGDDPREVVARAKEQASVLMDIVEQKKLYVQVQGGKKYLEVEAWQTIGAFNRVRAFAEWVRPIEAEGETIGYEAKVNLMRDGIPDGSAIMSCGLDEAPCRGKEGEAKHKAARSAAQTWAESKAYRMNYSFVAVLAGYEPTPADEMRQGQATGTRGTRQATDAMMCPVHNTMWFKAGKMPGYAHKVEGKTGPKGGVVWCNMEETQAQIATEKARQPAEDGQNDHSSDEVIVDYQSGTDGDVFGGKVFENKGEAIKWGMDNGLDMAEEVWPRVGKSVDKATLTDLTVAMKEALEE